MLWVGFMNWMGKKARTRRDGLWISSNSWAAIEGIVGCQFLEKLKYLVSEGLNEVSQSKHAGFHCDFCVSCSHFKDRPEFREEIRQTWYSCIEFKLKGRKSYCWQKSHSITSFNTMLYRYLGVFFYWSIYG